MSESVTLTARKVNTAPLKITVAIPPENPQVKGYFSALAIIRTKDANKALFERIEAGDFADDDDKLLHEMFEGFTGLGNAQGACTGDAAWQEVLHGELSAYLVPACIQAYYAQYGEARQGNSGRRR